MKISNDEFKFMKSRFVMMEKLEMIKKLSQELQKDLPDGENAQKALSIMNNAILISDSIEMPLYDLVE